MKKKLLLTLILVSGFGGSTAATVTGSCKSDGALASKLAMMRNEGKTIEQDLARSNLHSAEAHKFATLLWLNDELRSMSPNRTQALIVEKCQENAGEVQSQHRRKPLSCQMKSMLAQGAAEARDKGFSRAKVAQVLSGPGSELTRAEVEAVLNVAFGGMKTIAPPTVGKAILNVCEQIKR